MKILFLGTGTSVGIPVIGCDCPVCRSDNPKNRRLRASLYVEAAGSHILVDTSPDFRQQALQYGLRRIDAVLFTHGHADHIFGFDDIRRFNTIQGTVMPVYGTPETVADLRRIFDYVQDESAPKGTYRPRAEFHEIKGPLSIGSVRVTALPVEHGPKRTVGYLLEAEGRRMGYFPDCLVMDDAVVRQLKGVDVMILDALRHRPHATHLTVEDSVILLERIKAGRSCLVHMCHDLDHEQLQKMLPAGMEVSYDGMVCELPPVV